MPFLLTLILSTTFLIFHLWLAPLFALSVDEAHYALYAKNLALSYFDHPPLVGWLQYIALFFGDDEFSLRVIPIVLFWLSSILLYLLTRQIYTNHSQYVAFIAVLLLHLCALIHITSIAMLPETPLLFFGILAMKFSHNAIYNKKIKDWFFLAIVLGLAGLSKYSAFLYVISIILLIFYYKKYKILISIKPYLAVIVTLIIISPVLYWNYKHNWISFNYQLNHGLQDLNNWNLLTFIKAQLLQLAVYGPIIYIGGILAIIWSFSSKENKFFVIWSLPGLIFFAIASGYSMPLAHWTMFVWVSLLPLIAVYFFKIIKSTIGKYFITISSIYSLVLICAIYIVVLDYLPFNFKPHPLRDLVGWKQSALIAEKLRKSYAEQYNVDNSQLFVENWSYGSRIAWYVYPQKVHILDTKFNQFDLWNKPNNSKAGILISLEKVDKKHNDFKNCINIDRYLAYSPKQRILLNTFYFYWCEK